MVICIRTRIAYPNWVGRGAGLKHHHHYIIQARAQNQRPLLADFISPSFCYIFT